jgi:hypothetical protein
METVGGTAYLAALRLESLKDQHEEFPNAHSFWTRDQREVTVKWALDRTAKIDATFCFTDDVYSNEFRYTLSQSDGNRVFANCKCAHPPHIQHSWSVAGLSTVPFSCLTSRIPPTLSHSQRARCPYLVYRNQQSPTRHSEGQKCVLLRKGPVGRVHSAVGVNHETIFSILVELPSNVVLCRWYRAKCKVKYGSDDNRKNSHSSTIGRCLEVGNGRRYSRRRQRHRTGVGHSRARREAHIFNDASFLLRLR